MAAALGASFCVAPFIAMVDQAIVENTSGRRTLLESLKSSFTTLVRTPVSFFARPAFLLLWGVYGGTYIAANTISSKNGGILEKKCELFLRNLRYV